MGALTILLPISGVESNEPVVEGGGSEVHAFVDLFAGQQPSNYGMRIANTSTGLKLSNTRSTEGHASLGFPVDVDLKAYPELSVSVLDVGPGTTWTLTFERTDIAATPAFHLIPHNSLTGVFRFPMAEYLGTGRLRGTLWLYVNGPVGACIEIQRLGLLADAREENVAHVDVDAGAPLQLLDGFGGQLDYSLLDIGREKDGVSREEYVKVIAGVKEMGVTIARVGVYGDLVEQRDNAHRNNIEALVEHLRYLKANGIEPLLVIWMPPGHMRTEDPKTPKWRTHLVKLYIDFLVYLNREKSVGLRYFQICNEPHANGDIFTPEYFAQLSAEMLEGIEREKLGVEMVGPDVFRDERWLMPYLRAVGEKINIVAWKGGSGGGPPGSKGACWEVYEQAGMMSKAMDVIRASTARPLRIWATEYAYWGLGSPDSERESENGPADKYDYAFEVARLTAFYLNSGVSAPLLWELCDVRRIDDSGPPKRWGAIGYKDTGWRRRPVFYALQRFYRSMPPGSRVFRCDATGGIVACVTQHKTRWAVVLLNPFPWERAVEVELPSRQWLGTAEMVVTSEHNTGDKSQVTLQDNTIKLKMPARSIASVVAEHKSGWWQ